MKIPNKSLQSINTLIGNLKVNTFDDYELIKSKKELLKQEFEFMLNNADKSQDKLNELWEQDSNIEKSDFAWMEKENFKVLVSLFDVKELELLEKYIVI